MGRDGQVVMSPGHDFGLRGEPNLSITRSVVEGLVSVQLPLHRPSDGPPPHRLRRQGGYAILSLLLLAALLFAAPAHAQRRSEALTLVDLTHEFDSFWESSRSLGAAERVAAFRTRMDPLLPGFYAPRGGVDAARYDTHLAQALAGYPQQRDGVREVSRRFSALFAPALTSFERTFGRFREPQPIYLVHSLGEMDGGTRSLPRGVTLIFGADMIARYHLAHDIRPFFHHELFHLRHFTTFRECEAVWCSLWSEGLATYVAKRLNPGASEAELLLTVPEPIRARVDANRAEAVCAVVARFDSTRPDDLRALFSFRRLNERLPPRFGYYVGYLAAAELGRTHGLRELAAMTNAEVRPELERVLRRMAPCPPRAAGAVS